MAAGDISAVEPRDVVLHIGTDKTGTSSIQQFLTLNRERLLESDILYPRSLGRGRHVRLGLYVAADDGLTSRPTWHRQPERSPQEFRRVVRRRLFREMRRTGAGRVIFSDEALYGLAAPSLGRLRALTDEIARSVTIVVYLRRPEEHFCSRYQQAVKAGETRRLADTVDDPGHARRYDYWSRLKAWQRVLDPGLLVVRPFERERFVGGSLTSDFLSSAGVDIDPEHMLHAGRTNESLDAEAVEFLRVLNLLRVEEGTRPGMIDNRQHALRLMGGADGPKLSLPTDWLDTLGARWAENNRAVARTFLREVSGDLFQHRRRDEETTTDQLLDPGRVDHYVDLLELDPDLQPRLRRLAEREARDFRRA